MRDTAPTIFHTLLYLDSAESAHINMKTGYDAIDVYISCASLLASSLRYHDVPFRLLTNNRLLVESRLAALSLPPFEVVELSFQLKVPSGVIFHSAHYKLEIYSRFGSGEFGSSVAIVDSDAVMIAPPPPTGSLQGKLLAYDIAGQMIPKYGEQVMRSDIEMIGGTPKPKLYWPGGEFFLGPPQSFKALGDAISEIWPRYTQEIQKLHHVSDEMPVAAAATKCPQLDFEDAGTMGYIARWWTARTDHRQPTLEAIKDRSILHLPADKHFLAEQAKIPFHPAKFMLAYETAARRKLRLRRAFNTLENFTKHDKKYVASLA